MIRKEGRKEGIDYSCVINEAERGWRGFIGQVIESVELYMAPMIAVLIVDERWGVKRYINVSDKKGCWWLFWLHVHLENFLHPNTLL